MKCSELKKKNYDKDWPKYIYVSVFSENKAENYFLTNPWSHS